jgi:hypothetical protein
MAKAGLLVVRKSSVWSSPTTISTSSRAARMRSRSVSIAASAAS